MLIRTSCLAVFVCIALPSAPLLADTVVATATHRPTSEHLVRIRHGRYALMPAAPQHLVRRSHTIVGAVDTDVYAAVARGGAFSVTHTHLPRIATFFTSEAGLYEKASAKMLEEMGAYALSSQPIHEGGFAHEVEFTVPRRSEIGRARFALVGQTLVVVSASVAASRAEVIDEFFANIRSGGELP